MLNVTKVVLGSHIPSTVRWSFVHPVGRVGNFMPDRFVDLFAGGVMWNALDDIIVGVLARPISMLLLLEGLLIFLGCA